MAVKRARVSFEERCEERTDQRRRGAPFFLLLQPRPLASFSLSLSLSALFSQNNKIDFPDKKAGLGAGKKIYKVEENKTARSLASFVCSPPPPSSLSLSSLSFSFPQKYLVFYANKRTVICCHSSSSLRARPKEGDSRRMRDGFFFFFASSTKTKKTGGLCSLSLFFFLTSSSSTTPSSASCGTRRGGSR